MKVEGRCKCQHTNALQDGFCASAKKFGGVFCDWESTLMGLSVLYMFILQKSKKKNELVQSDLAC